jgi:hypothetical protein
MVGEAADELSSTDEAAELVAAGEEYAAGADSEA